MSAISEVISSTKHLVSDLFYERRYGVRTSGRLILDRHDADNIYYTPMNWRQLRWALPRNSVTMRDVFIDIGSGKGRAVLVAAKDYPFARVLGVEFVKEFHDIAQSNLAVAANRLRAAKVELICTDLRDYEIPDDVTVMYMNNPVRGHIFEHVLSSAARSIKRSPRRIRLIYYNPVEEKALLATGEWRKVQTIEPMWRRESAPFGTTCVYEAPAG